MAEFNHFYKQAFYYDIVYRRDVTPEVRFLMTLYQQINHSLPDSLLDLACGPGYHARAAAELGLRGIGLDLREEMLHFAADEADQDGVTVNWLAADMRYFQLAQPVDIVLNAFDGIDCLNSNEDLIHHMQAVHENLTPGGLYIVDVTHPRLTSFSHYEKFHYAGQRDGIRVEVFWATNDPIVNPLTSVSHTELQMHITEDGETTVITDTADERIITAQEIDLLTRLSGDLKPIAWFSAYDHDQPFGPDCEGERMIAILQKSTASV